MAMAQGEDEFGHYDVTDRGRDTAPSATHAPAADVSGIAWSSLGPFGGTIHDVAVSPVNPDIAIAGHARDNTRDGRLYISSDGGVNWSPVPDIDRAIHTVVFKTDGTAYAGGVGAIWRSTDDGSTWTELTTGVGGNDRIFDIALDPSDEDRIWACLQPLGSGITIMHSADGGENWENRSPPGTGDDQCSGITVHPGDSDVVAAAFWTGTVLWVTTDGGDNWMDRSAGLPAGRPMNTVHHDGTRLLAGGGQLFGGQDVGLFSTINLGTKWAPLHDATWPQQVVESIAVDATDSDIIYAGTRGAGINRTTDGGATWEIAIGGTDDLHVNAIEFDPADAQHLLIGTNSLGVFASDDGGANFELSTQGISEVQLYSVHANPLDPQELAVAFQGVNGGGVYTSTDGGATWNLEAPPPVRYRLVRFAPDGTLYAVSAGPTGSFDEALYRRESDGTWTHIGPSQLSSYDNDVFSVRFSINDPDLILLGARDRGSVHGNEGTIWRTVDGGENWTKVYQGVDFSPITSIEMVEDGSDQTMLAAFTYLFNGDEPLGGLLRSNDGGVSWSSSNDGLPATLLDGSLCTAADDPDTFYLSAKTGDDVGGVFRTQDQGVSWTATGWSGDAPGGIVCDPDDPQALYLMHTAGSAPVSRSDDQGATFTPFADGLEVVAEAREIAHAGGADPRLLLAGSPGSYAVDLSAITGAVLRFEPLRLNFGDQIVDTTSAPRAAMLRNVGDSDVTGLAFNTPNGDFSADTSACGVTLPAGGQCTISVTFTPSALGPADDMLTASGDGGIETALELAGNGVSGLEPPSISVDPDNFALALAEDQTATETLTIGNTGEDPLDWNIETAGPTAARGTIDCNAVPGIVIHDDGSVESGYGANPDSVNEVIFVDHFVPLTYPAEFNAACVAFVTLTGGPAELDFEVVLFDDSGAGGAPGTELGAVAATYTGLPEWPVSAPTWAGVDISSLDLSIASGGVYIGVRWAPSSPNVFITADQSPSNPVGFAGGYWRNDSSNAWTPIQDGGKNFAEYRSLFIRAVQSVPDCDNPSELDWLTVAPATGTTAGGGSSEVQVSFDTAGLTPGEYAAGLCITSNDPDNPLVMVPVELTVTGDVPPIIDLSPDALGFEVELGDSDTQVLSVGNVGGADLVWDIDETARGTGTTSPVGPASAGRESGPIRPTNDDLTRRADAYGHLPEETAFQSSASALPRNTLTGDATAWEAIGPSGGDVFAVAASTVDASIVLAGVAPRGISGGTLYRSTDGGDTWAEVPDIAGTSVLALEFAADGTAYAGTVDGVWTSGDDGQTWTALDLGIGINDTVHDIAIDPADPSILWVVIDDALANQAVNVMRSTDGGATWNDRTPPLASSIAGRAITVDPTNSDTVIAAFGGGTGGGQVWVTTDGGDNWANRSAGLPGNPMRDLVYDGTRLLLAGGQLFGSQDVGLYTSSDLGENWTPLHDSSWPRLVAFAVAVDPNDDDTILVATDGHGVHRTTNGGASWQIDISGTEGLAGRALRFAPGSSEDLYLGTSSLAVFRSTDSGDTFAQASNGIAELTLSDIHTNPNDPQEIAVTIRGQNDGGVLSTLDGGATWTLEAVPPTRYGALRFAPDGTLYALSTGPTTVAEEGLYRRENDGGWTPVGPDQGPNFESDLQTIRFSVNDPDLILLGGSNFGSAGSEGTIWRTTDAGQSWTKVFESPAGTNQEVTAIEIVEDGTDQVMIAAFTSLATQTGGVLRSTDGGTVWTESSDGLPGGFFRDPSLCAWAGSEQSFFLVGWLSFSSAELFRSDDAGMSWTSTGWIADSTIGDIACDPAEPGILYASQRGSGAVPVVRSVDQGATFSAFADGLTTGIGANKMAFAGDSHLLLATSQGGYATELGDGGGVACANPADIPWLSYTPNSGVTPPASSTPVNVSVDTADLTPGVYTARLCVTSNDPAAELVIVPIELTVTGVVPTPPTIAVDPESLSSSLPQGQSEIQPLTLSNLGDETLDWEILSGTTAAGRLIRPDGAAATPTTRPAPTGIHGLAQAADMHATGVSHPFTTPAGDQVTITHSESLDILTPHTVACSPDDGASTSANQFLRTFSLADFDITSDFEITEVTFGVEVLRDTDSVPITVKLYTLDGDFIYANLTEIGSATEEVPAQSQTLVTVPVTGTAPAESTLVVEITVPDLTDMAAFFPGSNSSGESAPSYIASAGCNIAEPTTFADIGFPQVHLVMTVTGTTEPLDCTLPDWADADPTNGSVAGGDAQMVDVTFDAAGLEAGSYEAQLCVGSNDPDTPTTLVPLALNVSQGTAAIDVTPALVDFGQLPVATASAPATVTIESNGTLDLEVDTITSPGNGFEHVGGDCAAAPFTLAPGESCTLDYVFTPPAESVFNSIVSITSNADPATLAVTLTGEGVIVEPPEDDIFRDRFEENP